MSIRTITSTTSVSGNSIDGSAGPFFPSVTTANVTGVDYWQFQGQIFWSTGATTVVGKPASSTTAITNTNAPYIWSDSAFPGSQPGGAGGYIVNTNSVVDLDDDGRVDVEEDVTMALDRQHIVNYGLFRGVNSNRPVFYGTTFTIEPQTNAFRAMNFIGANGDGIFSEGNVAAPQFHSCRIVQEPTSNPFGIRFQSPNYVINGLDYVNMGASGAFELTVPPKIAPQALRLFAPNFTDLRDRQILLFTNAFALGANDAARRGATSDPFNRYTFNQPDAANFSLYSGNTTADRVYRSQRGVHLINPIGSPIPFSTTTQQPADGSSTVDLLLPAREPNTANLDLELTSGQNTATKRVRLNFDQDGYTIRVRRNRVRQFDHLDPSYAVTWKGISRTTGNGNISLGSIDSASYSTDTATLGASSNSTTESQPNSSFDWSSIDLTQIPAGDTFRGEGYDAEISDSAESLLLPAHTTIAANLSSHYRLMFFEYEIWGHHDQRGTTARQTISFIPGDSNFRTELEDGTDIVLNFTSPVDTKVSADTSSVSLAATVTPPTTSQALYDNIKVYQRVRKSPNAYDSSRVASFTNVVGTSNSTRNLGALDLGVNTTGRLVDLTGNALNVRVGTIAPLAAGVTETWNTTGDIDLAAFSRNVGGRDLVAADFTNVGNSTGGSLTGTTINFGSATGTININGTDLSGIPNAGWTIIAGLGVTLDEPATNFLGATRIAAINAAQAGTLTGTFFNRTFTHEDESGVWGVYDVTSSNWEVSPVRYTTGGTPNTFNRDSSDANDYRIYWKRDSVAVAGFYETNVTAFDPSALTATLATATLTSTQGNAALYTPNSSITLSGSVSSALPSTERVTSGGEQQLQINYKSRANDGITYIRNSSIDQYLVAQATNQVAYIDVMGRRNLTADYIGFGAGDTRIDPDYVQLDTFFNNEQQEAVAIFEEDGQTAFPNASIEGLAAVNAVKSVILLDNPNGLTAGQALAAVNTGLAESNIATDQDIANAALTDVVSRGGTILGVDLTQ